MISKQKGNGGDGHGKAGSLPSTSVEAGIALPDVQPFRIKFKEFLNNLGNKYPVDKQGQRKDSTDDPKASSETSPKSRKEGQAVKSSARKEIRAFITASNDLLSEIYSLKLDCTEETKGGFLRHVVQSLIESRSDEAGLISGIATVLQHPLEHDKECEVLKTTLELIGLVCEAQVAFPEFGEAISSLGAYRKG